AIYFLDLAAEQRIQSPLLFSFDCGRGAVDCLCCLHRSLPGMTIKLCDEPATLAYGLNSTLHRQADCRLCMKPGRPIDVFSQSPQCLPPPAASLIFANA